MTDLSTVDHLKAAMQGEVVVPGDASYDRVRAVWNGMIDRRPAVIARCEAVGDVIASIRFAQVRNLPVSIRGGGHGVAGKSVADDALLIDMSPMNAVTIDRAARVARVQAGALLGDLDKAAQAEGLVTTAGIDPRTGVAGLTLGGGVGFLARRYGLTIDNLLAADLVTAQGKEIRASNDEHPDLFWALRGGGGNFGVVTSFSFRLHEFGPDVQVAIVYYPIEQTVDALHLYREMMADAPDEFAAYALVVTVPPVDPFPAAFHGKPAIAIVACHSGEPERGSDLFRPLETTGEPLFRDLTTMPYVALQSMFRGGTPDGERYYWKSSYFVDITNEAIEEFARLTQEIPAPYSIIGFEPLGGAIARVAPSATAFRFRDARFALGIWSGWTDPALDEQNIAWTKRLHEAMLPFASSGVYSNYLDADENDRVASAFGENYGRLARVKAQYDPGNFFRLNMNIAPAI